MITTKEGVQGSDISQRGYKKPMISRCSSNAAADDCWASETDYDAAAPLPMLVRSNKLYFLLQRYLGVLSCENKNSLAPQWYEISTRAIYWYESLIRMLLILHWALSNYLWLLWDSFHTFKIEITYTPYIHANFYIGSYAEICLPSTQKCSISLTWLFIFIMVKIGAMQKKRK